MPKRLFLYLSAVVLLSGCNGIQPNPAAPASLIGGAPPAPAPAGPLDDSGGTPPVASLPISVSPANSAMSAIWRPLSTQPDQGVPFVAPRFVANGTATVVTGSGTSALLFAPTLLQPVVQGTSVTVSWVAAAAGNPPSGWKLIWSAGSAAGSASFGAGTTSTHADKVAPGNYSVTVCAINSAGAYLDFCSGVVTFSINPQYPNPPRNLAYRVAANGTTVTLSWDAPAGGGDVDQYIVLYQGREIPVGKSPTVSGDLAPGTYLVGVLARNRTGDSAAVKITILVVQLRGTYSGAFRATTPITRVFDDGSCTWNAIYAGNINVSLTPQASGSVTGSVRISGTWSATLSSSTRPCVNNASGSYDSTGTARGTMSGFSATGINMGLATGGFTGQVTGSTVFGTLTAAYKNGYGTATKGVTLPGS